jgi:hypothetical protein
MKGTILFFSFLLLVSFNLSSEKLKTKIFCKDKDIYCPNGSTPTVKATTGSPNGCGHASWHPKITSSVSKVLPDSCCNTHICAMKELKQSKSIISKNQEKPAMLNSTAA